MKRQLKADRIAEQLRALYPSTPIPLDHVDPYTLLVAVLLSAQCTDARVNQVTPTLFAAAGDPAAMVALGADRVCDIIRPCGLSPTKARNIVALSRLVIEDHGGVVPRDMALLEQLPGVGHKTASVVVSQAFGQPAFPVDTHIHRLAWRWGLCDGHTVEHTEARLKRMFPRPDWNALHLQIIYFGREHCPALGHDVAACPVCSWAGVKKRLAAEARHGSHSAGRRALARGAGASRARARRVSQAQ